MCIGFAIGDALYFWMAGAVGYPKPFSQRPELSVLIVTVSMTAPMTAWMLYRRMPHRPVLEMSVVMPALAVALLLLGWTGAIAKSDLALTEHGLMMPAMIIPMLLRLEFYAGRATRPTEPETTGRDNAQTSKRDRRDYAGPRPARRDLGTPEPDLSRRRSTTAPGDDA
jgi:hypothetical protein